MTNYMKKLDYNAEIKDLKNSSLHRIYFLCGPEDYLRENFFLELKKVCVGEEDSFSYKKFDDSNFDELAFKSSIGLMPFLSDKTFIELRDIDFTKLSENLFEDIPDFCIIAIVNNSEPDNRLKFTKYLKENSKFLYFDKQDTKKLINWIIRRFNSYNKEIDIITAERLINLSGEYMNPLILEIEKIASYTSNNKISINDVNLIAHHIPEADTFGMINCISNKNFNRALNLLNELISNKDNQPTVIISAIGFNLRKLLGQKLSNNRVPFTLKNLKNDIEFCVDLEYSIKFLGVNEYEALKNIVLHIITNESK